MIYCCLHICYHLNKNSTIDSQAITSFPFAIVRNLPNNNILYKYNRLFWRKNIIGSFGENIISIPPKKISSLQKHDFPAARKLRFAFCGVAGYSVVNNKRGWQHFGLSSSWLHICKDRRGCQRWAKPIYLPLTGSAGFAICSTNWDCSLPEIEL